jgi:omega-6 fatty acid desaturase (delta-12 desaturase)
MSPAPWAATVARYRQPRQLASLWQLANTLLPLAGVLYLTYRSLAYPYWVTLLLSVVGAGLRVRLFVLMHDCGHRSFFRSRRANDLVGAVLGVMTWTPYLYWRRFHAMHHATSGNLDRRGWDMLTLTVREYRALPRWRRLVYRLFRNPLFMLTVAANYYFLVRHRFTLTVPRAWRRERRSVHLTNLALLAVVLGAWATVGLRAYLLVEAPTLLLGHAAGFWLFYVQHQHEAACWRRDGGWDYGEAALRGSSYFRLPAALRWFTANIGFHHVHHLNSRIPNYNLPRCHDAEPGLREVFTLTLGQSLRCARMNLWDEERQCMVSFADVPAGGES